MNFIKYFARIVIIASSTHAITGGAPKEIYNVSDSEVRGYALEKRLATRAATQTFFQRIQTHIACCPGIEHETLIESQFDRTGPWDEEGNCCKKCCVWLCRKNCTCTSTLTTCSCLGFLCAGTSCVCGVCAELVATYLYCSVIASFNTAAPYVAIGGGIAMGSAVAAATCATCIYGNYCARYFDAEIVNNLADPTSWGESERTSLKRDLKTYGININD